MSDRMASMYSSLLAISSSPSSASSIASCFSSSSSPSHTSLPSLSTSIRRSSSLCFATTINNNNNNASKLPSAFFSRRSVSPSRHLVAAACASPSSSACASASDIANQSSPESLEESAVDMAGQQALREAVRRLAEEDLEEAAEKYNLEEELFSEVHYAQVNAFTDRPFRGNPAAVCYLPYERDDQWLQLVAREFNLSETAFLIKRRGGKKRSSEKEVDQNASSPSLLQLDETGKKLKEFSKKVMPDDNEFDLRWFTPNVEVDLCGHATLASAHLMFSTGIVEGETILFHTKSGVLKARKISGYDAEPVKPNPEASNSEKQKYASGRGVVELDFPLVIASKCDVSETARVSTSLGDVEIVWCGKTSLGDYLVEVPSSKYVEQIQPRFADMMSFSGRGGVIVTAQAPTGSAFDFVSRFFCPKAGVPEDPVCGSAHCTLGPYWSSKLGKNKLQAYQASERGGKLGVRVDEMEGRAYLEGAAMLVMAGVLINTVEAE